VGFNDEAWTEVGLSADRPAVHRALQALQARLAQGTRLDRALAAGAGALTQSLPGRPRVMVLLTDGLPNRVPTPTAGGSQEDTVRTEASLAKAAGVEIYTVGLGSPDAVDPIDRINTGLLADVASGPAHTFVAPSGNDLTRIYRAIAVRVVCR
jgi:Mg-chelatase subunit ChlD